MIHRAGGGMGYCPAPAVLMLKALKSLMVLLRKCNNSRYTWRQSGFFSTCFLNNYCEVGAREGFDESPNLLTFRVCTGLVGLQQHPQLSPMHDPSGSSAA